MPAPALRNDNMALNDVLPGELPNDLNVIIEVPAHSEPVKYEIDKHTGAMFVDRFQGTSMRYPCNYGYLPRTLALDGDPLDVLVVTPHPVISGAVIRCRPLGLLKLTDDGGVDHKILAVPGDKLTPLYRRMHSVRDLPEPTLDTIVHFFQHYKDLEPGKWSRIDGWLDADDAKREIMDSIRRYEEAPEKPAF
jgi:inorganic pyrophosphatase